MTPYRRLRVLATSILALFPAPKPRLVEAAAPAVFLNHFFVVISAESYAAMVADPYLTAAFAPCEKRTTVRNDDTYTGAYWYGRRTYFEVFEPPSQGPVGTSGMAFGVEGVGESGAVRASWNGSLGGAETAPVTRRTEAAEPVWFHMTSGRSAAARLRLWLMEYDKDFLAGWYPDLTSARGITRGEVLDRYVAKIGRSKDRGTAVLGDVTGLVLALDDADRELLKKHVLPGGWTAKAGAGPGEISFSGPEGVTLGVVKANRTRLGIIEARFSVQGNPAPHAATLGQVRVEVDSKGARLRFVP